MAGEEPQKNKETEIRSLCLGRQVLPPLSCVSHISLNTVFVCYVCVYVFVCYVCVFLFFVRQASAQHLFVELPQKECVCVSVFLEQRQQRNWLYRKLG